MLSENNTRWASVVTYENIIEKKNDYKCQILSWIYYKQWRLFLGVLLLSTQFLNRQLFEIILKYF